MKATESILAKKRINIPDDLNKNALWNMIFRVTGKKEYADKFDFVKVTGYNDMDFYRMYGKGSKVIIEAKNTISAAVAFNCYLNEVCRCYFGPINANMNLPENPQDVKKEYVQSSKFIYRYFMNYCTFSYTFLFAGWTEYERLIDWMALSGINLVLNIVGHEIVERDMLTELGYSKEEASKYIAGPAYMPWQWMGNMTGFGGNMPDWWYEKQKALSIKINKRLGEFGMGIMMPGFFGMVPLDFKKKFPDSFPAEQGKWCFAFERQPILLENDPMFDKAADIFYQMTKKHFGDIKYFSGDPFHEGGKTDGINITDFVHGVVQKMKDYDKNAVWFLQGWQSNPKEEVLSAFEKDEVIIGFLSADKLLSEFAGYGGYPWLYMSTPNFGGTRKQDGNIKGFLSEPFKAVEKDSSLIGIGMTMEAIEMDEPVFDALSYISISNDKINSEDFIERCITSRYGYINENLREAYRIMLNEIYVLGVENTYRGRESILCARPSLDADTVSYWSAIKKWYTEDILLDITSRLFEEYDNLKDNACYRLDLMDFARQLIAEKSRKYLKNFAEAYRANDRVTFNAYTEKFLELFEIDNCLMGTNSRTRLDTWLKRAEMYAEEDEYKDIFKFNAKNLIVLWASKEGALELRDYAYREWNGMMSHYKRRWELYIKELKDNFEGDGSSNIDWSSIDYEFVMSEDNNIYCGKGDLKKCIKEILSDY